MQGAWPLHATFTAPRHRMRRDVGPDWRSPMIFVPGPVARDHRRSPARRLLLDGDIDISVVDALRATLTAHRREGAPTVVDLSGITFLDIAGLRALVEAQCAARRDGIMLRFAGSVPAPVRRLLDATR